jgi:hypothetical protein
MKPEAEGEEPLQTVNPYSIMQEIAKAVYLEDVLFGKLGSSHRTEVSPLITHVEIDSEPIRVGDNPKPGRTGQVP